MDRYKFIQPRLGFKVGHVVDESKLRLGIIRTLVSVKVLVKVENDNSLDIDKDNGSDKCPGEPARGKVPSADKPKRSKPRRKPKSSD